MKKKKVCVNMNNLDNEIKKILKLVDEDFWYMIDIDGVCVDTEERIAALAYQIGWKQALEEIDWHQHIYSSKQINHSLDILREVQRYLKRIQLLTTNHSPVEKKEKISFIRGQGIEIPIVSVPPKVSKSLVVPPSFYNRKVVLVDDKEENVKDWEQHGGVGILFTDKESKHTKVKSLEFLRYVR